MDNCQPHKTTDFNILLFDEFETLDAFGPAEIIGKMPETYTLGYYSIAGGLVASGQNVQVQTRPIHGMNTGGVLLIPGGGGTRDLVNDSGFIARLRTVAGAAPFVLTVCTGSALLAKTGLLGGRRATSNKRALTWVRSVNTSVAWVSAARWVVDGRFYTSSGVSAGMDMTLGFISDLHGRDAAQEIAESIEYIWHDDGVVDPFGG